MTAWYVAHTQVRRELWARSNLWECGFEVYLPQYRKRRRHARREDLVAMPLFPRYLFVRADLAAGDRRHILSAPGVESLVAFGDRPAELPAPVLAELRAREGADGYVALPDPRFQAGQQVRIANGPLGEVEGLFQAASDNDRVVVLMQLFARPVKVSLPMRRLARAG